MEPGTPASWQPDPSGRHEHRYWDGRRWTDNVSDAGVTSTDALTAPTVDEEEPAPVVPTATPPTTTAPDPDPTWAAPASTAAAPTAEPVADKAPKSSLDLIPLLFAAGIVVIALLVVLLLLTD
jgi:hypothetical protein